MNKTYNSAVAGVVLLGAVTLAGCSNENNNEQESQQSATYTELFQKIYDRAVQKGKEIRQAHDCDTLLENCPTPK